MTKRATQSIYTMMRLHLMEAKKLRLCHQKDVKSKRKQAKTIQSALKNMHLLCTTATHQALHLTESYY